MEHNDVFELSQVVWGTVVVLRKHGGEGTCLSGCVFEGAELKLSWFLE